MSTTNQTSRVVSIRLPSDLANQWDVYCQTQDKAAPKMYRALMRYILAEKMDVEKVSSLLKQRGMFYQKETQNEKPKERIEIRLTQDELDAVKQSAKVEGCSAQQWVICSVRAALTNEPQYTLEPARALWNATTELRAIGRNLNQIAKRINEGDFKDVPSVDFMQNLEKDIKSFTSEITRLQSASVGRWEIQKNE